MKKIINCLLGFFVLIFAAAVFATTLNIYEKPDENSKLIATMKTGDQLMPIFYTEKRDWVKVANPKNGEVGWAKVKELQGPIIITSFNDKVMQQQIVGDTAKNPQVYSIIQYTGPKELKPEDAQEMAKKIQKQQQEMENSMRQMQKNMQLMIQDMFKSFDRSFYTFPVIQPVIVVPDKESMAIKKKKEEKTN